MKMTTVPPTVPGYYWWTNLGDDTPAIVEVKDCGSYFLASNSDREFSVDPGQAYEVLEPTYDLDEPVINIDGVDYYFGTEFWAGPIALPELGGEQIEPRHFW